MPSVLVANLLTQQKYALTKLDSLFACLSRNWWWNVLSGNELEIE